MSVPELKRIEVLARVKAGTLKVEDAAVLLGVCERQAKRLWRQHRRRGPAMRGKRRCRLHGGLSRGPMTAEGLERISTPSARPVRFTGP
jgi:hypothetical protein